MVDIEIIKEMIIMKDLFAIAEMELIDEKNKGKRKNYTLVDIIDYAYIIRKWLNKHGDRKPTFEKNI